MQKRKLIVIVLLFLYWLLPAQEFTGTLGGNTLWSTKSGAEFLDRLLQDISQARVSVEIEYYWFAKDSSGQKVKEALMAKAREGIAVRVIMDNLITPFAPESFYQAMRKAGVELIYAHPFEKMGPFKALGSIFGPRDHRKIVVIDEHIAYTGGMNFYDDALYLWKDTQVRVEGPGAAQMRELFAASWERLGGSPLESFVFAFPEGEAVTQAFGTSGKAQLDAYYIECLENAKKYFYLQTPYFAPPPALVEALKAAAGRGIDVRIIVPDKSDWGFMNEITREYSIELMRAGVSIFVFDGAYDHTKIFITDDHLASCGTVNMDYRSLRTNWEDGYLFYDSGSISHFKSLFEELQEQSRLLGPDAQPARGLRKGYRKLIRKMSPLF